jgi:nicotinate-nucleotide--dimethylbenzimidazole phosphoribosyltransferase
MAESMSDPITHCPWCSVLLPAPGAETCPSCGAALIAVPNAPAEIKGVTTLDTEAILRARSEVSRPRGNRLLSFITGEIPVDTSTPAAAEVFAPPPEDVRREMRRLQMDAQRADLVAETVALKSDELARLGIHVSELGADEPVAEPGAAPPSPEAEPEGEPTAAVDAEAAPEGGWPAELTPDAVEPAPGRKPETEPESRD